MKTYKIIDGRKRDVEDYLNGILRLGPYPRSGLALGSLTLEFTAPAGTVTFSGSAGDVLDIPTIVSEINSGMSSAVIATMKVGETGVPQQYNVNIKVDAMLYIAMRADPTTTIDLSASTGATVLGLDPGGTDPTVTRVPKANIVSFTQGATPDLYTALIENP